MKKLTCKKTVLSFTLIELLVVIAIIAILAALLLPQLSAARDYAKEAVCSNNLRQCGTAILYYMDDSGGIPPYLGDGVANSITGTITEYLGNGVNTTFLYGSYASLYKASRSLLCPSHQYKIIRGGRTYTDYAMNASVFFPYPYAQTIPRPQFSQMTRPASTFLAIDGFDDSQGSASSVIFNQATLATLSPYVGPVHRGKATLLFLDNHAESRRFPQGTTDVAVDANGSLY